MIWIVALIILFVVGYLLVRRPAYENLPPGPPGWPVVGNLAMLDAKGPYLTLENWAKEYGPIYHVFFGKQVVILLNTVEAVRDTVVKQGDIFSGRPDLWIFDLTMNGKVGYANNQGEGLREQRKFAHGVFKELGVGRPVAEQRVGHEIEKLMEHLSKVGIDKPIDLILPLKCTVANIIAGIMFGTSFDFGDPDFTTYQEAIHDLIVHLLKMNPLNFVPFPDFFAGFLGKEELLKKREFLNSFVRQQIQKQQKELQKTSTETYENFTHAYLLKKQAMNKTGENHSFTDCQLSGALMDFVLGGFETTVTTLMWGILYLCQHPEIQRKVQEEIDTQVGRLPCWDDRTRLPYTSAVILEVHRVGSVVPLGVFHRSTEEAKVYGYTIPKDSTVIVNIYTVHRDPRFFPNPNKFDPNRFMENDENSEEDVRIRREAVIPFSMGKRMCLGEGLARMELFLVLTTLVYSFNMQFPNGQKPSTVPRMGFVLWPLPFEVVLQKRKIP